MDVVSDFENLTMLKVGQLSKTIKSLKLTARNTKQSNF